MNLFALLGKAEAKLETGAVTSTMDNLFDGNNYTLRRPKCQELRTQNGTQSGTQIKCRNIFITHKTMDRNK